MDSDAGNRLRQIILFLGLVALMLTASCTKRIRLEKPLYPDASLEEILLLYQKQQEVLPPLTGLMEITIDDTVSKTFWATWRSKPPKMEIEGFNPLGRTLFQFQSDDSRVSLTTEENQFSGSREAFREYLIAQTDSSIKVEWLALFDWIARGGLPHLSSPDPLLEKQDDQFILYFFKEQENKTSLTQKVSIDREAFRVREAAFFDSSGWREAKMTFDDYRPFRQTLFPFLIKMEAAGKTIEIVFKELKSLDENRAKERFVE